MQMFSNALFVTENIIMILLFDFSQSPQTWYALPVTVCVGSFALLGATMRVTHFYFLTKESNTVETPASYQPIRQELVEAYGKSVLNTRLGPQRLSTGIGHLPHRPHICLLGENYCLKFPSYDKRSAMLSRTFPELREHSIQELDDTDLNWLLKTKLVVLFSDSAAWYSPYLLCSDGTCLQLFKGVLVALLIL